MKRDYDIMRQALGTVAQSEEPCRAGAFHMVESGEALYAELARLQRDGLLDGGIKFGPDSTPLGGEVSITDEGREFWKLIENYEVWEIVFETLKKANIDISYPLLKEVCEEIVKRYVMSFIPN